MRYSASRLKAWMSCSLKAHFRYDEGLPSRQNAKASFGTVIHHSLNIYNTAGDYDLALKEFKLNWAEPARLGVEPDFWPKFCDYNGLKNRGYAILKKYHESQNFQKRTVLGTEIGFLVPLGPYELTGFIDLLEIKKSGTGTELLKIVDYKTNSREPNRSELALDVQFSVYSYAVSQREFWVGNAEFPGVENGEWLWETVGRMMPKRCIWYQLWNQKEIDAGPRTDTDYGRLLRVCDEIAKADAAGIYVPKIGESCLWCDYTEQCTLDIPVAINAVGDKSDPNRWI